MPRNATSNTTRATAFLTSLGLGITVGTALGAALFLVEVVWIHGELQPYLGVTLDAAWTTYLLFGAAIGLMCGVVGGIVVAAGRPGAAASRAFPVVGGMVGMAFTTLFLLRDYTIPEMRIMPAALVTTVGGAIVLWGLIIVTGSRIAERRGLRTAAKGTLVATIVAVAVVGVSTVVWQIRAARVASHDAVRENLPNVVMIVVDAMRPDHLGAYGYYRPTSPNIDELAREGVLFENTYSHGNRTILAMPSLFTSLYPSFHGAVGFQDQAVPLPQDRVTIAEMMRDEGYTTVGLMSNIYLKRPFGLTQGFDHVEEFNEMRYYLVVYRALRTLGRLRHAADFETKPSAAEVTDQALRWMRRAGDRPLFLYTHYMDVHHPYEPPPDIYSEFDRGTSRMEPHALFMMTAELVKQPPPIPVRAPELEMLVDLYDASIRYTDAQIGRILDAVRSRRDDRGTIVIITADHGDEFMERGSLYHNNLLIEELIRVPLIIWRSEDLQPRRVAEMVRHVDVMPTLAGLVGATAPDGIFGTSLVESVTGGAPPSVAESISEGDFCTALNTPDWKIMYVDTSATYYLYDLVSDPWGHYDVSAEQPESFAALKQMIDEYMARAGAVASRQPATVDPETYRQLRALGYIQ